MFITILTICSFSFFSLMILLGFKKTRRYFLRYSRTEISMILFIFITITLQILILDKDPRYVPVVFQMIFAIVLYCSALMLVVLLGKYKDSSGMLEAIIVLGVLQIAIAMTIASTNDIHWSLKTLSNLIYLTIPSCAIYILSRPKIIEEKEEDVKGTAEPQEKEISQSKGED